MTNDEMRERLEFLLQSTESLHANLQETSRQQHEWIERQKTWIERQNAQEQKEARLRRAMLQGIRTFLEELGEEEV